eukprot:GHVU01162188.1.p1 GENE.GHVU01162188.1~~GHVU01162188.1.p1  ORF type:complete len:102 (-),score=19.82 GHVU01162188.1:194-499(-)
MGFKKQTNKQNKQLKFKHVNIMAGYEFRNMTRKQVYQYLDEKNIYYDDGANIYEDLDNNVMYQLATKIYDNEIETIETKIDDNVYLITNLYKFIHNDKKKD